MPAKKYHCPECNREYEGDLSEIDGICEDCVVSLVDENDEEWEEGE